MQESFGVVAEMMVFGVEATPRRIKCGESDNVLFEKDTTELRSLSALRDQQTVSLLTGGGL